MRRTLNTLEGLLLAGVGLFMAGLALGDDYWMFMNPKFLPLTLAGGAGLAVLGVAAALCWRRPVGAWRLASVAALVALTLVFDPQGQLGGAGEPEGSEEPAGSSRLEMGGVEYVKLNPTELYNIVENAGDPTRMVLPYVARGFVRRSPELDARGEFGLLRINIWCCAADALAAGVRVTGFDPRKLDDGQWVQVFGRIQPVPAGDPAAEELATAPKVQGVFSAFFAKKAVFQAEAVKEISRPRSPFVYQMREQEPYAY